MGIRNYLIEGVSGTGKTSVCDELQRRGYYAIHGDRALAYQGDPSTGAPLDGRAHEHHIWDIDRVKALVVVIDATAPIANVVDAILRNTISEATNVVLKVIADDTGELASFGCAKLRRSSKSS